MLRKEVWKFLLGFYPWNSTHSQREEILRLKTSVLNDSLDFGGGRVLDGRSIPIVHITRQSLFVCAYRDEYFRMKMQWKSVSEEQEMRNSLLRGYRNLIG